MIKKLLFTVLAALPLCLAAQTTKFGVFNSQQIFDLMPEKATAEKTLNDVGNRCAVGNVGLLRMLTGNHTTKGKDSAE